MICPICGGDDVRGAVCSHCGAALGGDRDALDQTVALADDAVDGATSPEAVDGDHTVALDGADDSVHDQPTIGGRPPTNASVRAGGPLEVGGSFGDRYRIDELLGFGGMGAVYRAWDEKVGIPVALKVVRTGVTDDPAMTRQLDRRFKRELLLARQVTHKNVVRIHDLGEIEGVKFITMTYIDGEDLAHVLQREGTLSVADALRVLRPALSGLVAAHQAGVVHRDLKPANVMIEPSTGESYIMDFGIAKAADNLSAVDLEGAARGRTPAPGGDAGETAAGGLVGTLQYMAPEQLRAGTDVDQRADVYAFGLIFYDLLVGRRRIEKAASAISEFHGRVEAAPPPPRSLDPAIPEAVNEIVVRCLDPDPDNRFQSSAELEEALDRLDDEGHPLPVTRLLTPRLAAAAAALLVALVAGTWWLASLRAPAAPTEPISVLVADFVNSTGDAAFDGALEQALTIAMEGASFISAFPPANAREIAERLQPGHGVDEEMARLISRREGVSVILVGTLSGGERGYGVTVEALDPGVEAGEGRPLATARAAARTKGDVLAAVAQAAADLRGDLGDTTPESDRMAAAETFTTASLDAMRAYSRGQDLSVQGDFEGALAAYEEAVASDPAFGRAYAGMGVVHGNLRQEEAAEASYQKALQHLDRMSERERYRTLGGYYLLVSRNYEKAIENYETLVELFPADGGGHSNLAFAYLNLRDFDRAVASGAEAVELDPKNVIKRMNYAMYAMYAGDFATAMTESATVLEQNPAFGYARFTLGRAAMAAGDIGTARSAFAELGAAGGMGSSLAPMGEADLEMTLGRHHAAQALLDAAIGSTESPFERASMLVAMAEARLAMGDPRGALETARRGLAESQHESVLYLGARVLLHAGDADGMEEVAVRLEDRLQSQTTALAGLLRGERALAEGRRPEAVRVLREAWQESDIWFARFLLGRAYLEVGHLPEALDELDACVRRKGEITDVFLVDSATLRHYPPALYWLGRVEEAMGNDEAAAVAYRGFLELRSTADTPDELAADATARLGPG
ncbi:MAG: protein kinase [Thermoanaerobaculales bacterium]|nr:protein kinase [Thermoanaerobaculales bacterium]